MKNPDPATLVDGAATPAPRRRPAWRRRAALVATAVVALTPACSLDAPTDEPAPSDAQVHVDLGGWQDAPSVPDAIVVLDAEPSDGAQADAGAPDGAGADAVDDVDATPPAVLAARIASVPTPVALVGQPWTYRPVGFPAAPLLVELTSGPAGMVVDGGGRVSWTPAPEQAGDATVTLGLTVGGAALDQTFVVSVLAPADPVAGTVGPGGGTIPLGGGPLAGGALFVPPGALAEPVDLTAAQLPGGLGLPGATGPAVLLGPAGTTFQQPVALVLPASAPAGGLVQGVSEGTGAFGGAAATNVGGLAVAQLGHLSAWQAGGALPLAVSLHQVDGGGLVGLASLDAALTDVPASAVAGLPPGTTAKTVAALGKDGPPGTLQAVLTVDLLWGQGASLVVQAGVVRRTDGSGRVVARVVGAPPVLDVAVPDVTAAWADLVEPALRAQGLALPLGPVMEGPWGASGSLPTLDVSLRFAFVDGDGFAPGSPTGVPASPVIAFGAGALEGALPEAVTPPPAGPWTLRALPAPTGAAPGVPVTLACHVAGDASAVDIAWQSTEPTDTFYAVSAEAVTVVGQSPGRRQITCAATGPDGAADQRTFALDVLQATPGAAPPSCAIGLPVAAASVGDTLPAVVTAQGGGDPAHLFVEVGVFAGGLLAADPRVTADGHGGALVAATEAGVLTLGCRAFDGAQWGSVTTRPLQILEPGQHLPPGAPLVIPPLPVVGAGEPLALTALVPGLQGTPVLFTWGPPELVTPSADGAAFLAPAPGVYVVSVQATDGVGESPVTHVTVVVTEGGKDADGDGSPAGTEPWSDCDDADPLVHPGAAEICDNSVDDDCSGVADDCPPLPADYDGDGVPDADDACPGAFDPGQADTDGDGAGDACDPDPDGDLLLGDADPCPYVAALGDAPPADTDKDGVPDACDLDIDGDGSFNAQDGCPYQTGGPADCGGDKDADGVKDGADVCPAVPDPAQADLDGDGQGDACDPDLDGDGVPNALDTCPTLAGVPQTDTDGDGAGDACELDDDNDGIEDGFDLCPLLPDPVNADTDLDMIGDACDPDDDYDGVLDGQDNCPTAYNPSQADTDGDGQGDKCDEDDDGDGIADLLDDCPGVYDPVQLDEDRNGVGDFCECATDADCDDALACTVDACTKADGCTNTEDACFDGDPCTADSCDPASGCVHAPIASCGGCVTAADCDDKDACNGQEACDAGACKPGAPVVCDDGDACNGAESCVDGACAPGTPMVCDDGDICNGEETCAGGACAAGASLDCDDGDACTTDACAAGEGCVHAVVTCDDGDPCTSDSCAPSAGCVYEPYPDCQAVTCSADEDCTDHDPCNGAEVCAGGLCVPGAPLACDDGDACNGEETCTPDGCVAGAAPSCADGDPCTTDSCDAAKGCVHAAVPGCGGCEDDAGCGDGDACNGVETCVAGACVAGTPVVCDDGDACNGVETCVAGACVAGAPMACGDGDACNGVETCVAGACVAGTPMVCDDGDACNGVETCSGGACVAGAPMACGDGDACNGVETCFAGACVAGTPMVCDDGDGCNGVETCFGGACEAGTPLACDDGDPCNGLETCSAGACVAGTPLVCDDGDVCNGVEICVGGVCEAGTPVACDDGDACNGVETCSAGACVAGVPVVCDDGEPCNGVESCAGGACAAGAAPTCGDGDPCTADSCVPGLGCAHAPIADCTGCTDSATCDDGDACNGAEVCTAGVCGAGVPLACDDGNVCTDDGCDPANGCTHAANAAPCDDGDACTSGDVCAAKSCGGAPVSCDDGDPCNGAETCEPGQGCVTAGPFPSCGDGNTDVLCGEECDDGGNDPGDGCSADCMVEAPACPGDGDPCEVGVGACKALGTIGCPVPGVPSCSAQAGTASAEVCDGLDNDCNGAVDDGAASASCDDADACNGEETCFFGGCEAGAALDCDDGDACTADACAAASGCSHDAVPGCVSCDIDGDCDDADPCTVDACPDGACTWSLAPACACSGLATNGCDTESASPGCADTSCCETVCAVDPYCCNVAWDVECVGEIGLCGPPPGCGDGECRPSETCSTCPDDCGGCPACEVDADCDDGKDCTVDTCDPLHLECVFTPTAGCFCPASANPCFAQSGDPGCSDVLCCETVCAFDTYCCETSWDDACVGETNVCSLVIPPCGDGVCEAGETCSSCFDDCGACTTCTNDSDCYDGVDCTDDWCDVGLGECIHDPTPACLCPVGATNGCDATSGSPGCVDLACCEAVCAWDSFCCDIAWDDSCVTETVLCGDPTCGDGVCAGPETCASCAQDCGACSCTVDGDCDDGNECTADTCDLGAGLCDFTPLSFTECAVGECWQGACFSFDGDTAGNAIYLPPGSMSTTLVHMEVLTDNYAIEGCSGFDPVGAGTPDAVLFFDPDLDGNYMFAISSPQLIAVELFYPVGQLGVCGEAQTVAPGATGNVSFIGTPNEPVGLLIENLDGPGGTVTVSVQML